MIVTADADFTRLAVASGEPRPSIIHLRMAQPYDLPDVAERLRLLCNVFRDELESGAILAVGDTTERIRKLPLA